MDPYIGEIKLFPYQRDLHGWLPCDGRLLQINLYQALYSLLSKNFGGDGESTFGLPDLRGRIPVRQDYRYPTYGLGATGGAATVKLALTNLPDHTHNFQVSSTTGAVNGISGTTFYATVGSSTATTVPPPLYAVPGALVGIDPTSLQTAGASAAHNNMQPFAVGAYYISFSGVYPQRAD